jgi:hypothetical protein
MFTKVFLLDTVERLVKTFAQSLLALFVGSQANILNVDWGQALSVAGTAALVSFLTSLLSSKVGEGQSASLVVKPVEPQVGVAGE